jgi:hypothetical protein
VYQVRDRRVQSFFAEVGGISPDSRLFTSDLAVTASAFLVTYVVRLPTTGLLDRNKLRIARDTDMMDDSRKKDRMYLQ